MKIAAVLLFTTLASSTAFSSKETTAVVATVNGTKISKAYFDKIYTQNKLFINHEAITKEKVLIDIINRELGIQRAKKNNLASNEIVKEKIEDVLYHAQISKDLENELKKIKVSDKELKDYYSNNNEYRTAHILFRMRVDPSSEEKKAAITKARDVYQEIKKDPKKFAQLANKYSQSSAAPNGGDIGFQPAMRLAPEYYNEIRGKKPGYISPPVKTSFGIHIIKVLEVKPFKNINKNLYKKIVYDTKRDKILSTYFASLRKKADIKINKTLLK